MAHYSLSDAQSDLQSLVEKAERGEEVVIDRPDKDVVVKLVVTRVRPSSPWDLEWLDAHRVRPRRGRVNTAQAMREMKDESPR
jgi:hypothetical protein